MKKYIIFAISFILLFSLLQMMSGMLLTFSYTPDIEEAWNMSANLPGETIIKSSYTPFLLTLFISFLSASIAYFISNKIRNTENNVK